MIGLIPFLLIVVGVTSIGLALAKYGVENLLYISGAALIAASYAVRDAKQSFRVWFDRKMQEQPKEQSA